jgi:hypothetical protein
VFDQTEIDRIDGGEGIPTPLPAALWMFDLDLGDRPEHTMASIREVVSKIANQSGDAWPDDSYWRVNLPNWLVGFMPELSREDAERLMAETARERWNTLPWTFRSWLDAIRERAWRWWGYEISGRQAKLVLEVKDIPPRIEAFKQILLAAGATILAARSS